MQNPQQQSAGACGKCGNQLGLADLGGLCPRCLITEGLAADPPAASDTTRFSNPFFIRNFGDYELLQEIARGGMGVIYKAKQRSLGRIVAIKVMTLGEFASPEYVRRFKAEAAAAARLQHPNIVAIHEVGQHEGVRFFSMDFVDGPNLAQLLAGRSLPPERAATYLKTLAEAIEYAHKQGILHRDLKPSNVLIDPFGEPRVTDFGLAKELKGDSDLTVTGQVLGTPGYLPPEQADTTHGPLTPAADVYSLGAILYYMLTARAPFVSGSLRETLRQVLVDDPVALRLLNPWVPPDLETICMKCLERNPARRYQSAAALAEDLRRFLAHEPILARPLSAVGRFNRWCHRRPTLAAVWVLSVVLAVGSMTSAVWISRARNSAVRALGQARQAETNERERLREARLAEARALRRTALPGRRAQIMAALAEAAQVRSGPDLRDEALAAMLLPDVKAVARWDLEPGVPAKVTFTPAGDMAAVELANATGDERGPATLRRWDEAKTFGTLAVGGTNRVVGPLRFSQDGKLVMARYLDEALRIWRVGEADPFVIVTNRPLPGEKVVSDEFENDYDFSPDGKMFVLGLPGKGLSLHRTADGGEIGRSTEGPLFTTVRFAPDGAHVAATQISKYGERQVFVYDVPGMRLTIEFSLKADPNWLTWSSDGRVLGVAASDNTLSLFDLLDGRLLKTLACPGLGSADVTFLGGDSLIGVRGSGTTLRLLNAAIGKEETVIDGYGPEPLSAPVAGQLFVVTSVEALATRWEVEPPVGFRTISAPRPVGYDQTVNACCMDFSPDGRWVASGHGRFTLLRDVRTGRLAAELDTGDPVGFEAGTVAFCNNGTRLLRLSTRTGLQRYPLQFDPDGRAHFGAPETLDPEPGFMLTDHIRDGQRLVLVDLAGGKVKVVDLAAGAAKTLSRWETPAAYNGAFSADGESVLLNCAVTGTNDGSLRLRLHRVTDGSVIRELPAPASCDVVWSANGKFALTSNGQKLSTLWDTSTWQPVAKLEGQLGGDITTFSLAPDGSYGVINRDDSIYLISTQSGATLAKLEVPGGSGLCAGIRFLPDGQRFAVLWRDGRIDLIEPAALRGGLKKLGLDW